MPTRTGRARTGQARTGHARTRHGAALGRPPALLLVPAGVALTFLVLPLAALGARTPWHALPRELTDPAIRDAVRLSLLTSTIALGVVVVLGVPLAWTFARIPFPGRSVVRALVVLPLVLPPVVAGVALLSAFGRNGLLGRPLDDAFGLTLPYTTTAVVLAHAFVSLPFFVLCVEGALRSGDEEYDVVAATLGATRWRTLWTVSMPLALPGVLAGLLLAWARALGEFGATITFAGNYPGTTRTMPSAIYTALQDDFDGAVVLSVILMLVCVAVLVLLRESWFGAAVPGAVRR